MEEEYNRTREAVIKEIQSKDMDIRLKTWIIEYIFGILYRNNFRFPNQIVYEYNSGVTLAWWIGRTSPWTRNGEILFGSLMIYFDEENLGQTEFISTIRCFFAKASKEIINISINKDLVETTDRTNLKKKNDFEAFIVSVIEPMLEIKTLSEK